MCEDIANFDVYGFPRSPELIEALRDAFLKWYGTNYNIIEDGGGLAGVPQREAYRRRSKVCSWGQSGRAGGPTGGMAGGRRKL